jgi:MFS family permease
LQCRLRFSEIVTVLREVAESLRAFGSVFANANLRRLQLAGLGSTVGSWVYGVALAVYAYHAGGAKLVGLIYFARWGAAALGAPWIGLLADRLPRRRVMVAADVIRFALVASMAALAAGGQGIWPIFALAVLSTITSTAFQPAQGALLPSLVETPEELTAANAVMNTVASVGMFAGPALAGLLLATTPIWVVFTITAGTYVWSAVCLVQIPADARPRSCSAAFALSRRTQRCASSSG